MSFTFRQMSRNDAFFWAYLVLLGHHFELLEAVAASDTGCLLTFVTTGLRQLTLKKINQSRLEYGPWSFFGRNETWILLLIVVGCSGRLAASVRHTGETFGFSMWQIVCCAQIDQN